MEISTKNNIVINEGISVQEAQSCLLCGSKGTALYQNLRDRLFSAPGRWTLLRCPGCGLVWLNPRPIPEDIGKLYSEYFTHTTANAMPNRMALLREAIKRRILMSTFSYKNHSNKLSRKAARWLLSGGGFFRDVIDGALMWLGASCRGRLLDVGCGNGVFLATMQELGWEVAGVEPDRQSAKVAREQFGLNTHEGTLEEAGFADDTFDVITMSHVVEHLSDPISTLRECWRVLKKGGRVVITTPNIESLGHRLYRKAWMALEPPRHLFLFSPPTLQTCVERSGLQVLELRTTARSARWYWAETILIRRNGTLHGSPAKFWLQLAGLIFQAVEHGLYIARDAGEEVVMIANKRDEL